MSEKLCLQWNDFKENVSSAFGELRDDNKFTDLTLVLEDGQQMEAHKVIATSSGILVAYCHASFPLLTLFNKKATTKKTNLEQARD